MKSRYSYMRASDVLDEETGDAFPDPLSLDYHSLTLTVKPEEIELNENTVMALWRVTSNYYGTAELDDIVLTLNSVPHRNFLQEGDVLYFPFKDDIEKSFRE